MERERYSARVAVDGLESAAIQMVFADEIVRRSHLDDSPAVSLDVLMRACCRPRRTWHLRNGQSRVVLCKRMGISCNLDGSKSGACKHGNGE